MNKYTLSILAAGTLWGFMGLFVRSLGAVGISATGAVLLRCGLASLMFGLTLLLRERKLFLVRLKDFWCFAGSGLCSLLFFTWCYYNSMDYLSLSAAAVLLYTAPAIVILFSRLLFGEAITRVKLLGLVLAFAGCCLVSGLGGGAHMPVKGILFGLGAGFGYALYSVFARLAMNRGYSSLTVNFYTSLLAAAGAAVLWGADALKVMVSAPRPLLWSLGAGLFTYYLPYLLYTYGLSGTETGRASIMASLEPVSATVVGILAFGEIPDIRGFCGMAMVLGAILLLNAGKQPAALEQHGSG